MYKLPNEIYKKIFIYKSYYSNRLTGKFLHNLMPKLYELPLNALHKVSYNLDINTIINLKLASKKFNTKYIEKYIDTLICNNISRHLQKLYLINIFINASANLNKVYTDHQSEYIFYKKKFIKYILILLNRYNYIYLLNDYLYIILLKKMLCPFIINLLESPPYYLFSTDKLKKKHFIHKRYKHLYVKYQYSIDEISAELENEVMVIDYPDCGILYDSIMYKKTALLNFYINYINNINNINNII